ncbi:MAG: DUF1667 domain-containing protein [Lachnospiraceae bacterium]|nr:DUF1667 domain-containing protein [Lachnospiraceae bacterium]
MNTQEVFELTCIQCPIGCQLTVTKTPDGLTVSGNTCPRGEIYGKQEVTSPVRTVTSTVPVENGIIARVPVRTAAPVPKDSIMQVMEAVHGISLTAPVGLGDVLISNVAGTGTDLIATRDIPAAG